MKLKILSIDGGGVKGILPAIILAYIENKLIELSQNKNTRISDYLDFCAGTSTGSIISSMIIVPDEKGRPAYKMDDIVQSYIALSENVFKSSFKRKIKTLWGLIGPKYSSKYINDELVKKLDHWKMSELLVPCAFTGYDTGKRKAVIYTNKDSSKKYANLFIKDIVRGSTSIPYIFKPSFFRDGVNLNTVIDGGVFANNPSLIAYIEASKTKELVDEFKNINPTNILMLSFGTGLSKLQTYPYEKIKGWGLIRWFMPLINILLQGVGDVTAYQIEKIFASYNANSNYIRINPEIVLGNTDGQDSSNTNMIRLSQDAFNYISSHKEFLDNLAKELIKNDSKYNSTLF